MTDQQSRPSVRFCPGCGESPPPGANFCVSCGAPLRGGLRREAPPSAARPQLAGLAVLGVFLAIGLG
ncbi:MAG: hypothetical protein ACREQ9_01250, partial [Candidatus Binatia bacterium]